MKSSQITAAGKGTKSALDLHKDRRALTAQTLRNCGPKADLEPAGLLHHSDPGSQYTSAEYRACLAIYRIEEDMRWVANCYDDDVVESLFTALKAECAGRPFASRAQARTVIFE